MMVAFDCLASHQPYTVGWRRPLLLRATAYRGTPNHTEALYGNRGIPLQWFAFTGIGVVFTTCLILLGGGMVWANVVMVWKRLIV